MFDVYELNIEILTYLDIKTLINICFVNRNIYNILFNDKRFREESLGKFYKFAKRFWLDKFKENNLPILDNSSLFQEYIKISEYKHQAEKLLVINDMVHQIKRNYKYDTIIIRIGYDNELKMISKLSPSFIPKFIDDININQCDCYDFDLVIKPVIRSVDNERSKRTGLEIYDRIVKETTVMLNNKINYEEILLLIIKSLYYKIEIKYVDDKYRNKYHEIVSRYNHDEIQLYLNNIKDYINK